MIGKVAELMQRIGFTRAMIVCGEDAKTGRYMDEFSPCGTSHVAIVTPTEISTHRDRTGRSRHRPLDARRHHLERPARAGAGALPGNPQGPGRERRWQDFVCLNAAAIFVVAGRARQGVAAAREILASGAALERLALWRQHQR
jgi:anthranilate phosphoribosyltransferase